MGAQELPSQFPNITGYRILRLLGEGGMGAVYLAEEEALGRKVAVKVISEKVLSVLDSGARFQREARTMANLEHPHIVRVYAFGQSEDQLFLVMEYVDGEVLSSRIRRSGPMSVEEALRITKQIVEALQAAWEKKVVHRDIKPANVLIDKKEQVRVGDFGLAKPIESGDDTLTGKGTLLGTPHYISPEQALGSEVDYKSDIYSLGIVLYEMLSGAPPFRGNTPFDIVRKHLSEPLPALKEQRPDVPKPVVQMLEWMTQKKPKDRPTYEELSKTLDGFLTGISEMPTSDIGLQTRKTFRWKAIAAAIFVLLAAFTGWYTKHNKAIHETRLPPVSQKELVVVVAPFYGPDADSQQEGKVMAALLEKSVSEKLGEGVRVIGQDEVSIPIKNHEAARQLGSKLGANAVLWGEVLALRKETEIQPHFTMIPRANAEVPLRWQSSNIVEDPLVALSERAIHPVVLPAEAPNQIELRKTTAAGMGEIAVLLAGINSLYRDGDVSKAIRYFEQTSRSPESLYYRALALLRQDKRVEALRSIQEGLLLDPQHAPSHAFLGDRFLESGEEGQALASYTSAWRSGRTYTSTRGFMFDDHLYKQEIVTSKKYTEGKPAGTAYLLEMDSQAETVQQRYLLPGIAEQFTVRKNGVDILYDSGFGLNGRVSFAAGRFDKALAYPEDPVLRLQSMQGGWVLAANFIASLESNEYAEKSKFEFSNQDEDAPDTLIRLEEALQKAWTKDQTQPWHLFFLGQAYWASGNRQSAEQQWEQLFSRQFPGTPYYEFAWMADFYERLQQTDWADRAYEKARKRQKESGNTADYCNLVERIVNAAFIRQASLKSQHGSDLPRDYLWLERARRLSGVSFEGDDFAAAAWYKYFTDRGQTEQAAQERKVFRLSQSHPFNLVRATTQLDYALYFLFACTLAWIVFLVAVISRGLQACILTHPEGNMRWRWLPGFIIPFVSLCVVSFFGWWLYRMGSLEFAIACVAILLIPAVLLRSKITFRGLIASIPAEGRLLVMVAYVLFLAALYWAISCNYTLQGILSRPLRVSDVPANPMFVYALEQKLKESETDRLRFACAVANHLAGNSERARELYNALPGNLAAQKNLACLNNNIPPAIRLSNEELFRIYMQRPWRSRLAQFWSPGISLNLFAEATDPEETDRFSIVFRMLFMLGGALLFLFVLVPGQPKEIPQVSHTNFRRRVSKTVFLIIPGLFDLRCRSFWRGYAAFIGCTLVLISVLTVALIPNPFPLPGIVTLLQMPNYLGSLPFPTAAGLPDLDAIASYHYWTIFWSYADAKIFWGLVLAAGILSVSLHASRLRLIWRS